VETLLVFEHLFDTEYRGVSRVAGRRDRKPAILLALFGHLFLQTNRPK
jgi:hypothetical protein